MIKVNLSTGKKQVNMSNVGGFDFSRMKIKAVIVAILIMYLPDLFLTPMWEEELVALNQEMSVKQAKASSLKRKVASSQDFDKQIKELKAQEENLGQKLQAVKQAISEKKNPASLLLYVAKNVPNELWITDLSIEGDSMVIKGEALDYTSIGNFVNNLRSSVFIRDANIVSTNSTVKEEDKRRIESFEVKFAIARFDQ
jgi:Tfp pilus assembly protein PilN